jgi:putative hydrolase of the HAD superfamily
LKPRGVVFDYGNTLVPFGRREVEAIESALTDWLAREAGGIERERVAASLHETLLALHREREETSRESDPRDVRRRTLAALGVEPESDGRPAAFLAAYRDAFVRTVVAGPETREVLATLRRRGLRLGLLSNYSHAEAIRGSLARLGLAPFFDAVVVSADLGLVKPRRELFDEVSGRLRLPPGDLLFVGDNLKADVAGAKAAGMRAALTTEYAGTAFFFEHPEENAAEVRADITIARLSDLPGEIS